MSYPCTARGCTRRPRGFFPLIEDTLMYGGTHSLIEPGTPADPSVPWWLAPAGPPAPNARDAEDEEEDEDEDDEDDDLEDEDEEFDDEFEEDFGDEFDEDEDED